MYKEDLALNNLQWLICHKTKPNHAKPTDLASHLAHMEGLGKRKERQIGKFWA